MKQYAGIYHFPLYEAVKIAVRTAKEFAAEHPGELDVIKWVLFDDNTLKAYADEMDIDYYEKTMRKVYEAKIILDGLKDVKSGNTVDGKSAVSNIRSKYGI